jgi:hypothetical protein
MGRENVQHIGTFLFRHRENIPAWLARVYPRGEWKKKLPLNKWVDGRCYGARVERALIMDKEEWKDSKHEPQNKTRSGARQDGSRTQTGKGKGLAGRRRTR